ncbi:MAG: hypothetical protein ACKV2T_05335 [Kofleriaceae bacterium]
MFDIVAGYILGVVGLGMALTVAWITHVRDINRRMAIDVMLRCLRERRIERARKLCLAAPESFFDAVHVAINLGQKKVPAERADLEATLYPAFDDRARQLVELRKARVEAGLAGTLLAVCAIALASYDNPTPIPIAVIGGVAVLVGGFLLARRPYLANAIAAARAEILPALIDALLDGERPKDPPVEDGPFRTASVPVESTPKPVAPLPITAKAGASLRDGECPLCGHTTIKRVDLDDARFHKLVCASCGFTQEFADLAQLPPS